MSIYLIPLLSGLRVFVQVNTIIIIIVAKVMGTNLLQDKSSYSFVFTVSPNNEHISYWWVCDPKRRNSSETLQRADNNEFWKAVLMMVEVVMAIRVCNNKSTGLFILFCRSCSWPRNFKCAPKLWQFNIQD